MVQTCVTKFQIRKSTCAVVERCSSLCRPLPPTAKPPVFSSPTAQILGAYACMRMERGGDELVLFSHKMCCITKYVCSSHKMYALFTQDVFSSHKMYALFTQDVLQKMYYKRFEQMCVCMYANITNIDRQTGCICTNTLKLHPTHVPPAQSHAD